MLHVPQHERTISAIPMRMGNVPETSIHVGRSVLKIMGSRCGTPRIWNIDKTIGTPGEFCSEVCQAISANQGNTIFVEAYDIEVLNDPLAL